MTYILLPYRAMFNAEEYYLEPIKLVYDLITFITFSNLRFRKMEAAQVAFM